MLKAILAMSSAKIPKYYTAVRRNRGGFPW